MVMMYLLNLQEVAPKCIDWKRLIYLMGQLSETMMRHLMVLRNLEVLINMQIGLADTTWKRNPGMEGHTEVLTITTTIMTFLLPAAQILSFYTSNIMRQIIPCIILLLQIMS